jgi:hypothetical protein
LRSARLLRILKGVGLGFLFVGLLVLPILLRSVYYYRGLYRLTDVARPDHDAVRLPTLAAASLDTSLVDETPSLHKGRVVIDLAHENVVDDAELNVLLSYLTAHGLQIVSNDRTPPGGRDGSDWPDLLRGAKALIVISPHKLFVPSEVSAVARFVEQGGRVILMGDPSRFALKPLDAGTDGLPDVLGDILVPDSDVAALNSLASSFGLTFADDYLYNTVENAGNYQYVILKDFTPNSLTAGLSEVVFYAAHSIAVDVETLIAADEDTASSLSERRGGLAAMSLGGEGRVLAVADYTFMTEPYNTTADNSRLIANIADYVAGAERTFGLSDFPHFFGDRADLIYVANPTAEPALPGEAVALGARLRSAFDAVEKELVWHGSQATPASGQDKLYIGLYAGLTSWPEVDDILAARGITFTLETSAQALADRVEGSDARATRPLDAQDVPTPTLSPTPAPLRDWIHVPGIGPVDAKQTALLYQNEERGAQTLVVLAFGQKALANTVERLLSGEYTDCLLDEDRKGDPKRIGLALCPVTSEPIAEEPLPTGQPSGGEGPPVSGVEGGILVVSDDDGEGVYDWWTSAYDFADIAVEAGYRVTLWSTAVEGELDLSRMSSFDAVIWCTGDYFKEGGMPDTEDLSTLLAYLDGGGRLILGGAFLGAEEGDRRLLVDIQVAQPGHPLAEGFDVGQVIRLERFTADEDYETTVLSERETQAIVFIRGPASELAGQAAIAVEENVASDSKAVWMGLPLYLLPAEARFRLAGNAIDWILE